MTRDELSAALASAEAIIKHLRRALAEIDGEPVKPCLIDTRRAMKISGMSSSWLYANARKFGFGWRLDSGAWRFDEAKLRAFVRN